MYEIFEQLLLERGITAYKVAKDTGISQSTLSAWKARRNFLNPESADVLAKYFGVTLDYLMGKSEYRTVEEELKKKYDIMNLTTPVHDDFLMNFITNIVEKNSDSLKELANLCRETRILMEMPERQISDSAGMELKEYLNFELSGANIGVDKIYNIIKALNLSTPDVTGYLIKNSNNKSELFTKYDKDSSSGEIFDLLHYVTTADKTELAEFKKILEERLVKYYRKINDIKDK